MDTNILFALGFLILITLIIFKKEVMGFLREKTGIDNNRGDQEDQENRKDDEKDNSAG